MMGNLTIPEQPSEQRQGVLRDRGVDETYLSIQRLNRTATWLVVIIKGRINYFRVELSHCSQAHPRSLVPRVLRLTQYELSTRSAIAGIEPVPHAASAGSALGDDSARRPRIHATHHNIRPWSWAAVAAGIRRRMRLCSQRARNRFPIQSPEEVD